MNSQYKASRQYTYSSRYGSGQKRYGSPENIETIEHSKPWHTSTHHQNMYYEYGDYMPTKKSQYDPYTWRSNKKVRKAKTTLSGKKSNKKQTKTTKRSTIVVDEPRVVKTEKSFVEYSPGKNVEYIYETRKPYVGKNTTYRRQGTNTKKSYVQHVNEGGSSQVRTIYTEGDDVIRTGGGSRVVEEREIVEPGEERVVRSYVQGNEIIEEREITSPSKKVVRTIVDEEEVISPGRRVSPRRIVTRDEERIVGGPEVVFTKSTDRVVGGSDVVFTKKTTRNFVDEDYFFDEFETFMNGRGGVGKMSRKQFDELVEVFKQTWHEKNIKVTFYLS